MDAEAHKRLIERFYEEVWAQGDVSFAQQVFADAYVRHDLRPTQAPAGAAGQAQIADQFRRAFPDLRWRIDLILAEDDLVAARWTASGPHRQLGRGRGNRQARRLLGRQHLPLQQRRQGRRDLEPPEPATTSA